MVSGFGRQYWYSSQECALFWDTTCLGQYETNLMHVQTSAFRGYILTTSERWDDLSVRGNTIHPPASESVARMTAFVEQPTLSQL